MRFESEEFKLDFDNVLIRPKRSKLNSRSEISLEREFIFKDNRISAEKTDLKTWKGVPIIAANLDSVGTISMATELYNHRICTALHKFIPNEKIVEFLNKNSDHKNYVFYTMGIGDKELEKFENFKMLLANGGKLDSGKMPMICVDVANGYTERFINFISRIKQDNPELILMAGNVATPEMVEELILKGASIVKAGIGPGALCLTRRQSGVGFPQLSCVIECSDAAHGLGGLICSDGGHRIPGDLAKSFGAGADFVMLGSMLAGHDESELDITYSYQIKDNMNPNTSVNVKYKNVADRIAMPLRTLLNDANLRDQFEYESLSEYFEIKKTGKIHGMSSKEAMEKYYGGVAEHRTFEGKEVEVDIKGPVKNTILEILGGLRSTCTYVGAKKLKELSKRTTFVKVYNQKNDWFGNDL